eukprot:gnl/MRDRNA2_/MRDRNA2_109800_c0_seq1.p1 gnl/MRDRNA2_/MRDRNA2_109800_c0~~gnl/MRDRNA2_/MRDRNA2_109800_c0_seq1.p1  ORF type:complete len:203 (+),score=69.28 gnl/MRDRNA2_/MRDRNA2_109800_c0_seq1:93-701(+)
MSVLSFFIVQAILIIPSAGLVFQTWRAKGSSEANRLQQSPDDTHKEELGDLEKDNWHMEYEKEESNEPAMGVITFGHKAATKDDTQHGLDVLKEQLDRPDVEKTAAVVDFSNADSMPPLEVIDAVVDWSKSNNKMLKDKVVMGAAVMPDTFVGNLLANIINGFMSIVAKDKFTVVHSVDDAKNWIAEKEAEKDGANAGSGSK